MKDSDFKMMVMSAVNKLLAQGEQSSDSGSSGCRYRSNEGLCCIVGFMMDDETAKEADDLGDASVYCLIKDGLWGEDLSDAQGEQLTKLQGCHDLVANIKPFNAEFIEAVNAERGLAWVAEYIGAS